MIVFHLLPHNNSTQNFKT